MLTEAAMSALQACLIERLAYAEYTADGTDFRAELEATEMLADGGAAVSFLIDTALTGEAAVTEVRLYDGNGELWASEDVSITGSGEDESILYRFTFYVSQEEEA